MWGWITPERIQNSVGTISPQEAAQMQHEARLKKEAEQRVEESGVGECLHCGEEIRKNESTQAAGWTWESEYMLGWCDQNKSGNKHAPKIVWRTDVKEEVREVQSEEA